MPPEIPSRKRADDHANRSGKYNKTDHASDIGANTVGGVPWMEGANHANPMRESSKERSANHRVDSLVQDPPVGCPAWQLCAAHRQPAIQANPFCPPPRKT